MSHWEAVPFMTLVRRGRRAEGLRGLACARLERGSCDGERSERTRSPLRADGGRALVEEVRGLVRVGATHVRKVTAR